MNEIGLENVSVQLGLVKALDHVSISMKPGEVLLLAGPNGAGKSTLIKVLLGLVTPCSGNLVINGKIARVNNSFKESIGYLPENVAFAESLSGHEILKFFAAARGETRSRVTEVLDQIGLTKAAKRAVRGYSKGMRQRLGLGVAILTRPVLLILDEPTGGLDQEGLNVLWDVMETSLEETRTVLISSHDLTLLERRVSRVCLMENGCITTTGSPSDLRMLAQLPLRVTFELIEMCAEGNSFVQAIENWGKSVQLRFSEHKVQAEVSPVDLMQLMDIKARYSSSISRLRVEEPGLDMVYEALLKEARP